MRKSARSRCELVSNPEVRRRADADVESIRSGFPKGMSRPALRALLAAGFTEVSQLRSARESDLAALHGMGPRALELLRAALEERGKGFKG